jgi:hypothetical protein
MSDSDDFQRDLDNLLQTHIGRLDFFELERVLQERAQDMREQAYADGDARVIRLDDLRD